MSDKEEIGKVLFTNAKQRLDIILTYKESLKKISPHGVAKDADLPLRKRLIKIALIEELMCPQQLIEGTCDENIKFLQDCFFMLDSFVSTEDFEVNKNLAQKMQDITTNQEIFSHPKEFYEFTDNIPFDAFIKTQHKLIGKHTDSMTVIKVLDEFRKGNRDKALMEQLYEFIKRIK